MMYDTKENAGFTLIELLVTLALAAIILTQAVPSFSNLMQNNRLIAQKNEFLSTLNLARSEAIKRSARVTVCASTDQVTCNTNDWSQGWIVFADLDSDAVLDAGTGACQDTEDCLLRVNLGMTGGNDLIAKKFANAGFIQYTSRGTVDSAGTFVFCDKRGDASARAANINAMGRVVSASDSDNNGVVNDIDGADITCS
jgi:type IV fimbrial biogenesis protein FimT